VSSHGASRQIYTDGQGLIHGTPAHTRHHQLRTRRHGTAPTSLIQIACLSHVELADLEQSVHLRPSLALCPASAPASRTHSSTSRSWRIGAAPGQALRRLVSRDKSIPVPPRPALFGRLGGQDKETAGSLAAAATSTAPSAYVRKGIMD
jgi:hypothetical protein